MTLSLIWLGMASKDLLAGEIEDGRVLFQIFDQRVLPIWILALVAIVTMAITMSTLDTFCYLFSSSLAKTLAKQATDTRSEYIRFSKLTIPVVLGIAGVMALAISDIIQFIFSAGSLVIVLAPLYVLIGFGWIANSVRMDVLMSLSVAIGVAVYLVMFVRGDFTDMIMLVLPVVVSMLFCSGVFLYSQIQRS